MELVLSFSYKMLSSFNLIRRLLLRDFMHSPELNELGRTPFKTMLLLKHCGRSTMGTLCEHLGLERGSFTSVVYSLIERELIARSRNPEDRRQVLLNLTAEGERLVEYESRRLNKHLAERLSALSSEERERFTGLIEELHDFAGLMRSRIQ